MNFKYRMHDPRIGRFFAVDPLATKYPHNSPYAFSENSMLAFIELEGLEIYYAADGTLLGQVGENTHVFLVNKDVTNDMAIEQIDKMNNGAYTQDEWNYITSRKTTDTGMDVKEIRMRAFMTTIRQAEHGNKPDGEPLGYDVNFGGGTFDDFSTHPNNAVTKWGRTSTAAGAYQILHGRWKSVGGRLGIKDFTPRSQDRIAIQLMKDLERWNPTRATGLMENIVSGETRKAALQLNATWTSLPKGPEAQMTEDEFESRYNENFVKELNGETVIETPQGELINEIDED